MTLDTHPLSLPSITAGRHREILTSLHSRVIITHIGILVLMVCTSIVCRLLDTSFDQLLYPASILFTVVMLWTLYSWRLLTPTLFAPYPLFLLAAGLFNGGQTILEVFHLNDSGILHNTFPPESVVPAVFLATLGIAFLHLGALCGLPSTHRGSTFPRPPVSVFSSRATRITGWILLSVAAIPTALLLRRSLSLVMSAGYMGLYQTPFEISSPLVLAAFLVPGALFLLAGSYHSLSARILPLILIPGFSLLQLFMGNRGAAAMNMIALLWLIDTRIRRLPRILLILLSTVALTTFSIIAVVRNHAGETRLSADILGSAFSSVDNPLTNTLSEMGGSLVTIIHTLNLVPSARPFDYGFSYLLAALTAIPNIGWDRHPSVAAGLWSDWLVRTVDPATASRGGGLGFSFIAEAYANAGWAIGMVILSIIGYGLVKLLARSRIQDDPIRDAFIASFVAFFLMFARADAALIVRPLVWYCAIPYLLSKALSRGRNHRLTSPVPASARNAAYNHHLNLGDRARV